MPLLKDNYLLVEIAAVSPFMYSRMHFRELNRMIYIFGVQNV